MDKRTTKTRATRMSDDLDKAIEKSRGRLKAAIRTLERRIINAMKDLDTRKDGSLKATKINLKHMRTIHNKLVVYYEQYYDEGLSPVRKEFNRIAKSIQRNWPDLDNALEYTSVDADMLEALATQSLSEFEQFGTLAREQMSRAMYTQVLSAGAFSDLVKEVAKILGTATDARGNNMDRYASLWANDAIMNFHQSVTLKKARDAGMDYFLYYGNVIETSRQFCIDRAGKGYSLEEINSWADMSWKGKSGHPLTKRGGYNCRHHWMPIEKEWVPDEGIVVGDYFEEQGIDVPRGGTIPT